MHCKSVLLKIQTEFDRIQKKQFYCLRRNNDIELSRFEVTRLTRFNTR